MKRKLMEYIACPNCRGNLTLEQFETSGGDIEEGLLCCEKCKADFPVINGIPRILSSDLVPKLVSNYESFMRKHGLKRSDGVNLTVYDSDAGIAEGFEFEWQKHLFGRFVSNRINNGPAGYYRGSDFNDWLDRLSNVRKRYCGESVATGGLW